MIICFGLKVWYKNNIPWSVENIIRCHIVTIQSSKNCKVGPGAAPVLMPTTCAPFTVFPSRCDVNTTRSLRWRGTNVFTWVVGALSLSAPRPKIRCRRKGGVVGTWRFVTPHNVPGAGGSNHVIKKSILKLLLQLTRRVQRCRSIEPSDRHRWWSRQRLLCHSYNLVVISAIAFVTGALVWLNDKASSLEEASHRVLQVHFVRQSSSRRPSTKSGINL